MEAYALHVLLSNYMHGNELLDSRGLGAPTLRLSPPAIAMAPKSKSRADKNRNAARTSDKNTWKRFQSAMKDADEDTRETFNELKIAKNKKMISQFIKAWAKDPTWKFVTVFKNSFMQKKDTTTETKLWLTSREMFLKYGKRSKQVKKTIGPCGPLQNR